MLTREVAAVEFTLQPIGVVHSSISDPLAMPGEGVPASVEIYEPYASGLAGLQANSYVTVMGWLHEATRDSLVARRKREGDASRGVFASRSPGRPNPLGVSNARVTGVAGCTIHLHALDFVDGTPVVDVKGAMGAWDYAWSATGFRDAQIVNEPDERWTLGLFLIEVENFHGERCPGLALGVRMVYHVMRAWQVAPRDPDLKAIVGVDGGVADAVQALLGATLGNGRLEVTEATAFHFVLGDRQLTFFLHDLAGRSVDEVMAADESSLFSVSEGPAVHGQERPAGPALPLEGERRVEVLAAIRASLRQGKLPCPVAFRLSRQLGVGLRQIGGLVNEEGIKICSCQLGC
ncbi:MAG: TrmO family methyltransferase, partial [Dehalococcoidales bacterium]|nr:TrmO family methyltransferase [Dehalococcoidales bacterium]